MKEWKDDKALFALIKDELYTDHRGVKLIFYQSKQSFDKR